MRIVFFGTPELALPTLKAVSKHHDVVAVVTQPDRPRGRSGRPEPPPVKVCAEALGLSVCQPEKLHDGAFDDWLRMSAPDVCVLVAFGRLLKQPTLDVPRLGWLNLHPSLLPRWRGPSPIQTALLSGDTETGVTIMRVTLEMDAGDIVLQERTPTGPDETAGQLSDRLSESGASLMLNALSLVEQGEAPAVPQDPDSVTISHLFTKEHGLLRWSCPAQDIHNLVRACNPWPMAHCRFRGQVIRILQTSMVNTPASDPPGTVVQVEKDRICVAAEQGCVHILRAQLAGKKALDMDAFLRGTPILPGEKFEDIP